jgi:hypothetical protein
VSTQTDLLETCVSVYTDAITVKESHLVFIFGGKSTQRIKIFYPEDEGRMFVRSILPCQLDYTATHAPPSPHSDHCGPHPFSAVCLHCHILLSNFATLYVATQNINVFSSSFQHFKTERITRAAKHGLKCQLETL